MHKVIGCFILLFSFYTPVSYSLVILQYHHISDSTPKSTSLSPALFKQHLTYLKNNDFKVISLAKVMKALKQGEKIADKTVVITFDDGYRSIYDTAFPLLKKYQYPFTIFVHTSPIENKLSQFVSWQMLREMLKNGASVANHTMTHFHMIKRDSEEDWPKRKLQITDEITAAQGVLQLNLKTALKALAYPYGEFDLQSKLAVKELDFIAFGQHSGPVSPNPDMQALPRFPLGGNYGDMDDFSIKVNSLPMPIVSTILRSQSGEILLDHLIKKSANRPKLELNLSADNQSLDIHCYASNGERLTRTKTSSGYSFAPNTKLLQGRSRYNCTANSNIEGRFYWFSQPLILVDGSGKFY